MPRRHFILAHGCRGLSPLPLGQNTTVTEPCAKEGVLFTANQEGEGERGGGREEDWGPDLALKGVPLVTSEAPATFKTSQDNSTRHSEHGSMVCVVCVCCVHGVCAKVDFVFKQKRLSLLIKGFSICLPRVLLRAEAPEGHAFEELD